jgi:NAD(P)-dependent dehydrogenase (short-subunit alcohol dehydrogenase family)
MEAATRRDFIAAGAAAAVPLAARAASSSGASPAQRPGLLTGKRAVIYGAAGAIGSAVSRAFAREGAQLYLAGRTFERVKSLADELAAAGARASPALVDALDRDAVEKHLAEVVHAGGGVDISFNLIGLGGEQGQLLTAMTREGFAVAIDSAMRTHFLTATAAARHMMTRGGGVILALTAQVARKPYVASGGFGVACAAIEGLWRQLAVELGPSGIRLVTLRSSGSPDAPGVAAAIAEHAKVAGVTAEAFEARIAEKTMLKRMPKMAEIANAAVLAASDHASSLTAAVLNATCGEIAD